MHCFNYGVFKLTVSPLRAKKDRIKPGETVWLVNGFNQVPHLVIFCAELYGSLGTNSMYAVHIPHLRYFDKIHFKHLICWALTLIEMWSFICACPGWRIHLSEACQQLSQSLVIFIYFYAYFFYILCMIKNLHCLVQCCSRYLGKSISDILRACFKCWILPYGRMTGVNWD